MKFTDITIQNFLTVGEDPIIITLDSRGMVVVNGDNRDDSSAISNGAGKSSIGDAICWALYGETARGETGDAIINDTIGKNCCVEVIVEDSGSLYSIARYRKHKTHKNSLQVTDKVTGAVLTKGTDKLTQELVEKIVGCSLGVFRSAIYAGQESIPDLPGMTDKNLKEIVEEAAGVNRLTEAYQIAREDLRGREAALAAVESSVANTQAAIKSAQETIDDLTAKRDDYDNGLAAKLTAIGDEIDKQAGRKKALNKQPELTIDSDDANAQLKQLAEELSEFVTKKTDADKAVAKAQRELDVVTNELKSAVVKAKGDMDKVRGITDRIGQPCGECGKLYCEEDLDQALEIAKKVFGKSKAEAEAVKSRLEVVKKAHTDAVEAASSLTDIQTAITANKAASDDIRAKLKRADDIRKEIALVESKIDSLDKSLTELKTAANPYEDLLQKAVANYGKLTADLMDYLRLESEARIARDLAADAVKVFSPAGVRAHVLDTVTPMLNDRTSHYLSVLSDGNISATWNTLTKGKSGELKEKFAIDVINDKGAKSFKGLSGGEKRKVRLASALALQDLVASRATKPIDLMIGDEIDDALDDAGLERLMMVLNEKALEKGTVLLISHNSLSDWAPIQWTVIKEGGFSRLEEN